MKNRTDYVTSSSSSSFVLEICIELNNGKCIVFVGQGSCGEGDLSDFGELEMSVSPKQLGNAASVQELVDMLRSGVVDAGFWRKKLRIMDERDEDRRKEAEVAHARSAPVAASYDRAVDFIRQVERIPDINAVKKITVSGNEYNRQNYLRTYVYDRVSCAYTKEIKGSEFEKNGGSGGDLRFSDEVQAVDPRTLDSFHYTADINFLNFRNRSFVTTGFTNAEKKAIEQEIIKRGGTVESTVRKSTYCLIANEDYGRTTEKYDSALLFNSGADLFYGNWIKPKEPDPNSKIIYIISRKTLELFLSLQEGTCLNPSLPPYYIHGTLLIDVSARTEDLDLSGTGITKIDEQSFFSCQKIRQLTLPLAWFPNGCFVNTDMDELRFTQPIKDIQRKGFGDRPLPKIRMPLFRIGDCKTPESKQALINCFLEEWVAGNSVDPDLQSGYDEYLRSQKKRYYENETALRYLAARGFLPKKDALDLARTARESGNESQAAALEQGTATAPAVPKKGNPPTTSEDKLWSTKKLPDGTLTIRLYKGMATDIVVPAQLKGMPVTKVENYAFCADAKELSEEQKEARRNIQSIAIPEGIRQLGSLMLPNDAKVKRFSFPEGLEWSCGLSGAAPDAEIVCPVSYYGVRNAFSEAPFTSFSIPDGVKVIGDNAFYGCTYLNTIRLPDGLTMIGDSAFSRCGLESVELPASVTALGQNVFFSCINLKTVRLPEGLTEIPFGTFSWCENLESIEIPAGVTVIHGGAGMDFHGAFFGCKKLRSVILHEGLKKIEPNAFDSCQSLKSIVIPDSVDFIDPKAFLFCDPEIRAHAGSYAEQYARENGLRFTAIDPAQAACDGIKESSNKPSGNGDASSKAAGVPCANESSDRPYHAESYQDYICFLKNAVIMNKGHILSDAEAEQFIVQYNLDADWGITLEDLKNDMEEIAGKRR